MISSKLTASFLLSIFPRNWTGREITQSVFEAPLKSWLKNAAYTPSGEEEGGEEGGEEEELHTSKEKGEGQV